MDMFPSLALVASREKEKEKEMRTRMPCCGMIGVRLSNASASVKDSWTLTLHFCQMWETIRIRIISLYAPPLILIPLGSTHPLRCAVATVSAIAAATGILFIFTRAGAWIT